MIFLLYACLLGGFALLVEDQRSRFVASADRVRWLRLVGLVAAAVVGLVPLLAWLMGALQVSWPFPIFAIAYLVSFLALAGGVLGLGGDKSSIGMRRAGYLGLLVLEALSFTLLLLAPLVLVAGVALAQPRATARQSIG